MLVSARLKHLRAREHLFALEAEIQQYWAARPFETEIRYDELISMYVVSAGRMDDPPARLGLIAGNLAQDARAALDHAVHELSVRHEPDPKRTAFPIVTDARVYERESRTPLRYLDARDSDVARAAQPMHAADSQNAPLERLRRLSNADKHRFLQPATAYVREGAARYRGTRGEMGIAHAIIPATDGEVARLGSHRELMRVRFDPPYSGPLDVDARMHVFMAFGDEVTRLAGLAAIVDAVQSVLAAFIDLHRDDDAQGTA